MLTAPVRELPAGGLVTLADWPGWWACPGDQVTELVPPGYAELGVGAVQVRGDGARGQEQPVGDLAVGQAAGQDDDLALLRGEFRQRGRWAGRGIDAHTACS